jgi:cobalt-zinc-cadmium resistance protein CzcA
MITARNQSLEIKNQLRQVMADVGISKRKLQTLLNTTQPISITDTVLCRMELSPLTDSMALAANPALGYIRQQSKVAHITGNLEQSRMLPDLSIGYFSQTMIGTQEVNGSPRSFDAGYRFSGIQAGLTLPLWFGPGVSKTRAARMQELSSLENAGYYASSLKNNLQSLKDESGKYATSLDYYEQQAIPEATLIIDQATRSYKAGALDYLDYVINLNRALDIRQNYLDALYSYNQTIISIENITGKIF